MLNRVQNSAERLRCERVLVSQWTQPQRQLLQYARCPWLSIVQQELLPERRRALPAQQVHLQERCSASGELLPLQRSAHLSELQPRLHQCSRSSECHFTLEYNRRCNGRKQFHREVCSSTYRRRRIISIDEASEGGCADGGSVAAGGLLGGELLLVLSTDV